MASVYLATDEDLGVKVAVKVLRGKQASEDQLRRFKRELLLARRISHPAICRVFDLHREGDVHFITMEYVPGESLAALVAREGTLPEARVARVLSRVCRALHAAHTLGVVHRDLKPENIVLLPDDRPKLIDFGVASAADAEQITQGGFVVGTPHYMSPEMLSGQGATVASDVYAVGVIAYRCLTGQVPFDGPNLLRIAEAVLRMTPRAPRELAPGLSEEVEAIVLQAMHRDPAQRFDTAAELAAALAQHATERQADSAKKAVPSAESEWDASVVAAQRKLDTKRVALLRLTRAGTPDELRDRDAALGAVLDDYEHVVVSRHGPSMLIAFRHVGIATLAAVALRECDAESGEEPSARIVIHTVPSSDALALARARLVLDALARSCAPGAVLLSKDGWQLLGPAGTSARPAEDIALPTGPLEVFRLDLEAQGDDSGWRSPALLDTTLVHLSQDATARVSLSHFDNTHDVEMATTRITEPGLRWQVQQWIRELPWERATAWARAHVRWLGVGALASGILIAALAYRSGADPQDESSARVAAVEPELGPSDAVAAPDSQAPEPVPERRVAEPTPTTSPASTPSARAAQPKRPVASRGLERSRAKDRQSRLRASMEQKGLITGDDEALDSFVRAAADRLAQDDFEGVAAATDAGMQRLLQVKIDRGFVQKKLTRANRAMGKTPAAMASRLGPVFDGVRNAFVAADYPGANRHLNVAFELLAREAR